MAKAVSKSLARSADRGQLKRYDSEYKRNDTANLFVFLNAH
jgi:hypothetical protein